MLAIDIQGDQSRPYLLGLLANNREVAMDIAFGIGRQAQSEGLAEHTSEEELRRRIDAEFWQPAYAPIEYAGKGA